MNTLRVEAYNLGDFLEATLNASKDGWKLDLVSNDNYPQKAGEYFYCTMVEDPDFKHQECEECKKKLQAIAVAQGEAPVEEVKQPKAKKTKTV